MTEKPLDPYPIPIQALFQAKFHSTHMKNLGRLQGKHCVARKERAQAKRKKSGKKSYNPV